MYIVPPTGQKKAVFELRQVGHIAGFSKTAFGRFNWTTSPELQFRRSIVEHVLPLHD
jgi:hypothetical protein